MSELLQTPPLTSPSLNAVEVMIEEVADLIGGSDDLDARNKAIRMLDRAADRLNGAGVYLFRKKEATFGVSPVFTSNQATLETPEDFAFPTDPAICKDVNGNVIQVLEWKPWEIFRSSILTTVTNIQSVPAFLSILNPLDETIYLFPYIDPSKVSTIVLTYFARIVRVSEVDDGNVYLTPEGREALITGGQALMVRQRYLTKPNIWIPMMQDFDRTVMLAKAAAFRQQQAEHISIRPDESGSLSNSVVTPGPRPTVYLGF